MIVFKPDQKTQKEIERDLIRRDVENFLADGGRVDLLPPEATGLEKGEDSEN